MYVVLKIDVFLWLPEAELNILSSGVQWDAMEWDNQSQM